MNISSGDDLYISGFNRDLRDDLDDALSVAKSIESFASMSIASSNHSLRQQAKSAESSLRSGNPRRSGEEQPPVSSPQPAPPLSGKRMEGPIEVDFYRNPTVLSRMILYNKFVAANKRCRDHPLEAAVWVCAKRKSNVTQVSPFLRGMLDPSRSNRSTRTTGSQEQQQQQQQSSSVDDHSQYSLRQLPIHIACTSLAFAHDPTSRSELEQLIVRLVVTYPEGCAEFDHGGKLPLHEAIWSNASSETTAMLLMASPQSIDRRDKFGRTCMELNNRRTGDNKGEIQDMLLLGVQYWDQARQEAKLRMKMATAPPPSADKSIDSTSVLGASEIDKETIYTRDSIDLPARSKPHPVQIESEEIVPMAWEQLERRVFLLEQLLAETYEKNYELAGLVEELKQTKVELSTELEAARAALTQQHPPGRASLGSIKPPRSPTRSSLGSCFTVAVVPEDDEVSSVKLMEHAERIEQLESLVGSYHSSRKKRRNTGGSSKISELSSVSSETLTNNTFARQDSLVSGLTDEASYFDTSIHAVKQVWRKEDLSRSIEDISESEPQEALATDNLTDIFHKATVMQESSRTFGADTNQRQGWAPPIAATSFLPDAHVQSGVPAPIADEEEYEYEEDEYEEEEEDDIMSAAISATRREDSKLPATPATPSHASEIYFPGFRLEPTPAHVNSTISISASSVESSAAAMSENSTIVSDEREIYFAVNRQESLGTMDDTTVEEGEGMSSATRSTRGRLEDFVFGSSSDGHEESEVFHRQAQRYNYDIRIPALDKFHPSSDTGEI